MPMNLLLPSTPLPPATTLLRIDDTKMIFFLPPCRRQNRTSRSSGHPPPPLLAGQPAAKQHKDYQAWLLKERTKKVCNGDGAVYLLLLLLAHHVPGPGHLRQRLPREQFLRQHIVHHVSLTTRSNTETNACMEDGQKKNGGAWRTWILSSTALGRRCWGGRAACRRSS